DNFKDYNFNKYIAKIEKLEYNKMLNLDIQIFKINSINTNININANEICDITNKVKDSIIEIEETNSKSCSFVFVLKTSTTSIQDHLIKYELLEKKAIMKIYSEKKQVE
ncbi:10809_t:CDS:2, partial [Scutellospora calospora]